MYWTPDGTCYEVFTIYESVSLAFLNEGGEGIRFKVKATIIEMPEPYSELLNNQYELYIYFADIRFCQKNIIDDRYRHKGKEYICVTLDVFPDGNYELIYFQFRDSRYIVEKTIDIDPHSSYNAGGIGIRHKVKARQVNSYDDNDPNPNNCVCRLAALYWELNKWFTAVRIQHDTKTLI